MCQALHCFPNKMVLTLKIQLSEGDGHINTEITA